jgi:hypothetical protein
VVTPDESVALVLYSNVTAVLLPFALIDPFRVAPAEVTEVAALLVAVGGIPAEVVKSNLVISSTFQLAKLNMAALIAAGVPVITDWLYIALSTSGVMAIEFELESVGGNTELLGVKAQLSNEASHAPFMLMPVSSVGDESDP